MGKSPIEWTNYTWNVIRGCSRVSTGCEQCYAERTAYRFNAPGQPYEGLTRMTSNGPRWTGKIRLVPEKLDEPLRMKKPTRIFVNSMSDLFHENIPFEFIDKVFAVMGRSQHHIFQILTKRPERMLSYFESDGLYDRVLRESYKLNCKPEGLGQGISNPLIVPLPNVWLGVSVEDQPTANERIPVLLRTPAAVRWISVEPLLGQIYLGKLSVLDYDADPAGAEVYPLIGTYAIPDCDWDAPKLDWVVVGGESGPKARPMVLGWAKDIVRQCKAADVPVFVKQIGANPTNREGERCPHIKHKKGADMSEWPDELRVQEYPG